MLGWLCHCAFGWLCFEFCFSRTWIFVIFISKKREKKKTQLLPFFFNF